MMSVTVVMEQAGDVEDPSRAAMGGHVELAPRRGDKSLRLLRTA